MADTRICMYMLHSSSRYAYISQLVNLTTGKIKKSRKQTFVDHYPTAPLDDMDHLEDVKLEQDPGALILN